jgi:hypothetical protein
MIGLKTVVKGAIGLVGVVLILFVSCPDEDSFNRWAQKTLVSESGSGLEKAKGKALATQANWTADYRGHTLWATVDAYQGGDERRYVGALGMWFRTGGE